jgi:hypothetical protein
MLYDNSVMILGETFRISNFICTRLDERDTKGSPTRLGRPGIVLATGDLNYNSRGDLDLLGAR